MKYKIQDIRAIAPKLKVWARKPHIKAKVHADFRQNGAVRLAPIGYSPAVAAYFGNSGCTIHIHAGFLLVACSKACQWIEEAVCQFLAAQRIITGGIELVECPIIPRRIQRASSLHRLAPAAAVRRRVKKVAAQVAKLRRFSSVFVAVEAAARDAGPWLVVTDRALRSAALSDYNDPDYIYAALMALALAAKTNAGGAGLGMAWADFLSGNGSHDYCPHSSDATLQRFRRDYIVVHGGEEHLIEAHVRCGTGSGSHTARIYVAQPERPGLPVVVGHVGSHLPIAGRSH